MNILQGTNLMGKQKKSLSLEDYDNFQQYRNAEDFTVDQLNKVIFIHGFAKIHRRPKAVLYDALSTVDLVNLPRSTLTDLLSPPYSISFSPEEARTDLEALNWMECPIVQSVETVGRQEFNGGRDCEVAVAAKDFAVPPRKISRKRGRPRKFEASSGRDFEAAARDFAMRSWKISRKRRRPRAKRMTRWRTAEFGFGVQPSCIAGAGGDEGVDAAGGGGADTSLFVDTYRWEW